MAVKYSTIKEITRFEAENQQRLKAGIEFEPS